MNFKDLNYKLVVSGVFALLMGGTVIYLAVHFSTEPIESSLNILIVILGLALGWLLGILLSPYDNAEDKKFTMYAKAFGVFASGYLVGKVDKFIEELFNPAFILDSVHGFRVMAFMAALIISMVITFIFRLYDRKV
jgi:hypothetical protein